MKQNITKLLNVELLKPGFVLATDIYQYNSNVILYKKGTVLTESKINRLKKFGIISIQVDICDDLIITNNDEIVKRKIELDFNQIYEYANYIVLSVMNKKDVKDMMKIIDDGIYDHSRKVALLSTMVGMNIENFSQHKLEQLAMSSLLHDIGKSTIDFSILNKPEKLTEEEYIIIQKHSQNGFAILENTGLFSSDICEAVLSHHENEDGSGYPNCKIENEIPLYSRIIHICDVYSALTNRRCYKDEWSNETAIGILEKDKEKFEPNLLDILKTSLPIYLKDDMVYLSNNELGTVINTSSNGILVKLYGNKGVLNINDNNNSIYIKKKIKTRY